MIKKVNRSRCIELNPKLAHFNENSMSDAPTSFYPEVYASYVLTYKANSIEEHIEVFAAEITWATKEFGYDFFLFMPHEDSPWIKDPGESEILWDAVNFLMEHGVDAQFDGGLRVRVEILPHFLKHVMRLAYYHPDFPTINFIDEGQNFLCSICGHGNMHVDILTPSMYELCIDAMSKTRLEFIESNNCREIYQQSVSSEKTESVTIKAE
jgi:hypothetical protein